MVKGGGGEKNAFVVGSVAGSFVCYSSADGFAGGECSSGRIEEEAI
jgi:hypothetical protein